MGLSACNVLNHVVETSQFTLEVMLRLLEDSSLFAEHFARGSQLMLLHGQRALEGLLQSLHLLCCAVEAVNQLLHLEAEHLLPLLANR